MQEFFPGEVLFEKIIPMLDGIIKYGCEIEKGIAKSQEENLQPFDYANSIDHISRRLWDEIYKEMDYENPFDYIFDEQEGIVHEDLINLYV